MNHKKLRLDKQIYFFRDYFQKYNMALSEKAMYTVLDYHDGERKDGSPEATHMYDVAGSVLALMKDRVSIEDLDIIVTAGFLHDLIEDYFEQYNYDQLIDDFGDEVAKVVRLVSKPIDFNKNEKDAYKEYYKNIGQDFRAVIIKAKDRIDNMKTMKKVFTIKRQKEYIQEVKDYILPLLKKTRFENEEVYMIMADLIQQLKEQIESYEWMHETLEELNVINNDINRKVPTIIKNHNQKSAKSNKKIQIISNKNYFLTPSVS